MQQRLGADIDGYLARTAHFAAALAASEGEVEEAQRLRYRVFADEFGARIPGSAQGLDRDDLDAFCHHLLVRERQSRMLVGTYRSLPAGRARSAGGFYAEREFDLRGLRGLQPVTVEVGRACVHPDFRHGSVIALLWAALLRYLTASGSRHVMGCASVGLADGHAPAAATCGRSCEEHPGPERWRAFPRRPFPTRGWSRTLAVEPPPLVRGRRRPCLSPITCPGSTCTDSTRSAARASSPSRRCEGGPSAAPSPRASTPSSSCAAATATPHACARPSRARSAWASVSPSFRRARRPTGRPSAASSRRSSRPRSTRARGCSRWRSATEPRTAGRALPPSS